MFHQTPGDYTGPMPYAQNPSHPGEMENYYESVPSQWPGVESTPYGDVGHPYSGATAFPSSHILTPISLPDASYPQPRASPVLSHHSQEYSYHVAESVPPHGLGITAPFPSEFPRTVTTGLPHGIEGPVYDFGETSLSPEPQRTKRVRRSPHPIMPSRETPVNILPHPEGLQRLEHERQLGPAEPHLHRPRAPGRGRRDPQAEEEDTFVERLREQNLAWKVIREKFREKFHKDASEARLQMRMLRRRKDRLARWDENDIQLLIRARDYWEREKYNFISQKMREFGSRRVYTPQQCEAQLRELDAQQEDHHPQRIPPPRATDPQHARRRAILKASRAASTSIPITTTAPMTKA